MDWGPRSTCESIPPRYPTVVERINRYDSKQIEEMEYVPSSIRPNCTRAYLTAPARFRTDSSNLDGFPERQTSRLVLIGLLLISHGQLGRVLLETASEIVGPFESSEVISVGRRDRLSDVEQRIDVALDRLDVGDGVLVLADMFGGTAANVVLRTVGTRPVEVVTGFNLPMLLKIGTARPRSEGLAALAQLIKFYGQRNVILASEMLKEREKDG